jgi:hypothetical protein
VVLVVLVVEVVAVVAVVAVEAVEAVELVVLAGASSLLLHDTITIGVAMINTINGRKIFFIGLVGFCCKI